MQTDRTDKKAHNYALRRSILDYGMGVLIIGIGIFFAFSESFGVSFTTSPGFRYAFASLCLVYGGFRIYRGYKKNYFSE